MCIFYSQSTLRADVGYPSDSWRITYQQPMIYSEGEQAFLTAALAEGLRHDGRGLDDYRTIHIAVGVVENAEGSCRVKLGGTEVEASVRPELAAPAAGTPDVGSVAINIEWGTCA